MNLIQLTHLNDNYELWVDPTEIIAMERFNKTKTTLLTIHDDKSEYTALVLKCGKVLSCKEPPCEIINLMKNKIPNYV